MADCAMADKFELYRDAAGQQFRFRLKANSGC